MKEKQAMDNVDVATAFIHADNDKRVLMILRVNVDDIMGGSIHRLHRDPKKVEAILRNPAALPHEADFEFGDVVLRTVINAVWDETGQLEAYVVNWEDITESKKLESALSDKLRELNKANQELLKRNWQIEQDEADLKVLEEAYFARKAAAKAEADKKTGGST